jgi:type IX secretion system PorP/SprF family membrane protein
MILRSFSHMTLRYTFLSLLLLLNSTIGRAQDPQFTQFYAAPQYLNPAFAGSALAPRATINYRNQWPSITNYVTTVVGLDHFVTKLNSGIGLMLVNDSQGQGAITSTEIAGQYSFQFQVGEASFVRLGVQGSYVNRSVNYFGLVFGDQIDSRGIISGANTRDRVVSGLPNNNYVDFATGGLFYSDWFWVGMSAHHINRPNQSFSGLAGTEGRLPIKGSLQAGLRIPIQGITGYGDEMDREISFSPVVNYKFQGKYDQLDLGAYLTYSPITIGAYYRGIPFKKYDQRINNHDAVAGLIGYRADKFSIGYSYDATISTLGFASGGSHEISLSYVFDRPEPSRGRYRQKKGMLSCPKF